MTTNLNCISTLVNFSWGSMSWQPCLEYSETSSNSQHTDRDTRINRHKIRIIHDQHFLSVAQKTVSDLPSSHTSVTSYINNIPDVSPLKLSEVDALT